MEQLFTTYNESHMHRELKKLYSHGGQTEAPFEGFVVDILQENRIIEVQTGSFGAIKKKIARLKDVRPIRIVYPVAVVKHISHVDPDSGEVLRSRKSPKKGSIFDLFGQLVYYPDLITEKQVEIEVLLVEQDEIRTDDGKGSWRRKGVSITDRRLIQVNASRLVKSGEDLLNLLPDSLPAEFTNGDLAEAAGIRKKLAQQTTWCLHRLNLVERRGKSGRQYLYKITI